MPRVQTRFGRDFCGCLKFRGKPAVYHRSYFFHQAFTAVEIFGFDGRVKNDGHGSRLDCELSLWHNRVCAHNRDRHNRNTAFHGEVERAFFKRQQLAVERSMAFDINRHVEPLLNHSFSSTYRFDSSIAIATIDRHERPHPHGVAENWNFEQLFFHHHRSALRDERSEDGRIQIRDVIRHKDVGARWIEFTESNGFYLYPGQPNTIPRPEHEHAVEQANVASNERPGKADQSGNRERQYPEGEHGYGADHYLYFVLLLRFGVCPGQSRFISPVKAVLLPLTTRSGAPAAPE